MIVLQVLRSVLFILVLVSTNVVTYETDRYENCNIVSLDFVSMTSCNMFTNSYDVTLSLSYQGSPERIFMTVAGQSTTNFFPGASPQLITYNLPATGDCVDINVMLTGSGCSIESDFNDLFTAPERCMGGCYMVRNVSCNLIPNTTYGAMNIIETSGVTRVASNGNVIFEAGQEVILNPDFAVESGGLFSAIIQPCTP